MLNLLSIFLGGGLGSLLRYEFSCYFPMFFLGTFLVNFIGCCVLGYCCKKCPQNFFTIGFCGGFTTLGTFLNELCIYMQYEMYLLFVLYLFTTFATGIIGIVVGNKIGNI